MRFRNEQGSPKPFEVWNARLYFDNMSGAKNRPVIVLEKRDDEFTVLMVTTSTRDPENHLKLHDPYEVMLDMSSSVRTDRLFRIPEDKFNYKLGELVDEDVSEISELFEAHKLTKAYKRKAYRL
ncbi:MAG: type II toxin-antitoxin system PemK/MazF family toxin [Candidatus Methanomethylophilaceae archaeon]|nr:type II toxin-antitoxin system PemK/MazF family toxin [Candidatus Methanomethylophilaceae archaeon]